MPTSCHFACVLTIAATAAAAAAAPARPNVVVILADDQGWGDLSVHGNTNLKTPHIDALAADGARFPNFFVQPVCSPTRAEFLTGRYHPRGGVRGVSTGGERLDTDEKTIADAFRAAGYATGCFGKWHNGTQYPYHPNGRGFDEYYGFTSGHWGEYFDPPLDHNGEAVRGDGYVTDDLTAKAIAFMRAQKGRPFLAYIAYNTPHSPMQVPDEFYKHFADKNLDLRYDGPLKQKEDVWHTRAALAMCENIDWNVGRVLAALKANGLAENTIVVYFSDNGPNGWRWNAAMKGRKGSTDEGGVKSPLFVRWPGHVKPGTVVDHVAAAIDLYPTLADLAGVGPAKKGPFDGRSLKPLLVGGAGRDWPNRTIVNHWGGKVSARDDRFRLDDGGKLYDLTTDPSQTRDVANARPGDLARMRAAVEAYRTDALGELPRRDDRPFTVGYPAFPRTTLPARDGQPHGGVERSSAAPNCSFFTNWTSPDDRITWDVEVATPGVYELVIEYTCPAADVGSTVEANFNGKTLTGKVVDANDPPLRGKEHDRTGRHGESYVKDFRPLRLGTVDLPAGRGLLTLRASAVPGRQVMDVRAVVLTLAKSSRP